MNIQKLLLIIPIYIKYLQNIYTQTTKPYYNTTKLINQYYIPSTIQNFTLLIYKLLKTKNSLTKILINNTL